MFSDQGRARQDREVVAMLDFKKSQRKFCIAAFFAIAGTAGWFFGRMGGGEFIALVTLILAAYNTANVLEKKNQ